MDSNIPMYLIGRPGSHRDAAASALEACVERGERLVTDAEVYQEIVHRYSEIGRPAAIQPAFDALSGIVDEVLPITKEDVFAAKDLVLRNSDLSARDAVHAAVMKTHGLRRILTFDTGFDDVPGVERVS